MPLLICRVTSAAEGAAWFPPRSGTPQHLLPQGSASPNAAILQVLGLPSKKPPTKPQNMKEKLQLRVLPGETLRASTLPGQLGADRATSHRGTPGRSLSARILLPPWDPPRHFANFFLSLFSRSFLVYLIIHCASSLTGL